MDHIFQIDIPRDDFCATLYVEFQTIKVSHKQVIYDCMRAIFEKLSVRICPTQSSNMFLRRADTALLLFPDS